MSEEHDDRDGGGIDWAAYQVPDAPAGAVAAICAAVDRGTVAPARPVRRGAVLAIAAAAVVVAAAVVLLVRMRGGGERGDDQSAGAPVAATGHRDAGPPPAPVDTWSRRFASAADRVAMARAIAQARDRRAALRAVKDGRKPVKRPPRSKERVAGAPGGSEGDLDKEYIRSVVKDAVPLVQECYEMALDEDPTLAGRVVVEFTIAGEPEVGGLVEDATVPEEGPGKNATMAECMRETMLSLRFPAPTGGGVVTVRYPFVFASGDTPPAGGDGPPAGGSPADGTGSNPPPEPPEPASTRRSSQRPVAPLGTGPNPGVLAAEAREALQRGQYAAALRRCEQAAAGLPDDQEIAQMCAIAACQAGTQHLVQRHYDRLDEPRRRDLVRQVCLARGIALAE